LTNIKPVYLVALALVIVFVAYLKISNPYREFSRSSFWQSATVDTVNEIPQEALEPGNKNGPVLMWAAIGGNDPEILKALVARGAQINEADGIFKGTPLTGAAGYTKNPQMIDALIDLGADIHKTVHNGETALMIAAQYNHNPGIISALLKHGADLDKKSDSGKTALDFARENSNKTAIKELGQPDA
jgi:ankyrin repeat protein